MSELTHLQSFVVLAEELHFGRAAERLHISQPPLTQQMQRLEAKVGVPLFRRGRSGTQLTAAGAAFLPFARQSLQEAALATAAARAAARGERGSLVVATPPSVMLAGLPESLARFRAASPDVHLQLREMSTTAIIELVRNRGCDFGYLRATQVPEGTRLLQRQHEGLTALLPKRHRLAKVEKIRLQDLATEEFVLFPPALGSSFHEELLAYCRRSHFVPHITQEATQWSSVLSLVAAGFGVTIAPAGVAKLCPAGLVAKPLVGLRTTILLVAPEAELTPVAERYLALAAAAAEGASTASPPSRRKV